MKTEIIISAMCAALMLTSCASAGNTEDFADTLPSAGRLKLNVSETSSAAVHETADVSTGETVTETKTAAEIQTESETLTETEAQTERETLTETEVQTERETLTESQTATEVQAVTVSHTAVTAQTKLKDFSGESPVKLIYGGKCVSPDSITDVKKFFGKPVSPEISAPSCLGDGEDIVYIYSDFTVSVYAPAEGKPQVVLVISTGSSVGNPKGVTVGASEKSAIEALGGDSLEENGVLISFFAENGIVTEVDYIILV